VVLTTRGDAQIIEQITKQLNKLIRVHKVRHFVGDAAFERELCVATVKVASARAREDLERVLRLTGARVLAFAASTFTVEATGTSAEITQFIELVRPLGIRDMVRSAPIALARGAPKPTCTPATSSQLSKAIAAARGVLEPFGFFAPPAAIALFTASGAPKPRSW
jgi:acetolactate synthase small subunit